jgi:hypothetical protein
MQLQIVAERKGEPETKTGVASLAQAAGAGPSGVSMGTATIDWGKLPEGTHTFKIAIQPPAQKLIGAIEPPREVQVVVKGKDGT